MSALPRLLLLRQRTADVESAVRRWITPQEPGDEIEPDRGLADARRPVDLRDLAARHVGIPEPLDASRRDLAQPPRDERAHATPFRRTITNVLVAWIARAMVRGR